MAKITGKREFNHKWTKKDNIVALYYHKFGTQHIGLDEKEIVKEIGTTISSLKMQAANFRELETGNGLSDFSTIQKKVYDEFNKTDRYPLFLEVKKSLNLDEIQRKKILKTRFKGRKLRKL